jgi:methyl-accepting chemotaxis protein
MDIITQRNSALVEENAATAKTLEHQAQAMDERIAYFQIDKIEMRGISVRGTTTTQLSHDITVATVPTLTAITCAARNLPLNSNAHVSDVGTLRAPGSWMQAAPTTAIKEDPNLHEF